MTGRKHADRKHAEKKVGKRVLISAIIAAMLLGGLGVAGAYLWSHYGEPVSLAMGWTSNDYEGGGTGEVLITVTEGETGADIAASLHEEDVVKTYDAFYDLLLEQEPAPEFMPGAYTLRSQMSAQAALDALLDPENRMELTAMIPEGASVEQTLEIVSAGADIPLEELTEVAEEPEPFELPDGVESLEGWFFPATYEFEMDTTATEAIERLVGEQKAVLDEFGVEDEDRERVLNIASIVQRESGVHEDFGKVSRVIHNRLDEGMLLQMDSTAQYGMGEQGDGSVWSSDEALRDDNPWNTYVHEGLPEGPIANPGRDAIAAALEPETGNWLYFVVSPGGTGESTFTEDAASHEEAVQEYVEWCEATPDSDC